MSYSPVASAATDLQTKPTYCYEKQGGGLSLAGANYPQIKFLLKKAAKLK